jgi:hypothetical protein
MDSCCEVMVVVGLRGIDGILGVVGAAIEARRGKYKGQEETPKDIAV